MWAPLGNLVHQFPEVVTLAYYLHFTHMIHRQKDLIKEYIQKLQILSLEKTHIFQTIQCRKNVVQGLKTAPEVQDLKTAKNSNCATIKETGKLKETKWNRWVATNILLDQNLKETKFDNEMCTLPLGVDIIDNLQNIHLALQNIVERITPDPTRDIYLVDFGPKYHIWMQFASFLLYFSSRVC